MTEIITYKNAFQSIRAMLIGSFVSLLLLGCGMDGDTFTAQDIPEVELSIAKLDDLQVSTGSLEPAFDPRVSSYFSTQPNHIEKITITPVLEDGSVYELFVNGQPVITSDTSADTSEEAGEEASESAAVASVASVESEGSSEVALEEGDNVVSVTLQKSGIVVRTYNITFTRETLANVNVTGISLHSGELKPAITPAFTSAQTNYTANVEFEVDSVMLVATLEDPTNILSVNGIVTDSGVASQAFDLAEGSNLFNVVATANDFVQQKAYQINVTRASNPLTSANLLELTLSSGNLDQSFAKDITYYTHTVANQTTTLTLSALAEDDQAQISLNTGSPVSAQASQQITLNVGVNNLQVLVTGQDGSTKNYIVAVTRLASSNADLSNLSVSTGSISPVFSAASTSYTHVIPYATSSLTVTATVADSLASLAINGSSLSSGVAHALTGLNVGSNVYNIQVSAEDKSVKTYSLLVTREGSSDASLSALTLSTGALNESFNAGVNSYTQTVLNGISSVSVNASVTDPAASVRINNIAATSGQDSAAIALSEGENIINITVVAQDNTSRNYYVVITRDFAGLSSDATLSALSLSTGVTDQVFNVDTLNYTQTVGNATDSIIVNATTSDTNALLKVNGGNLTSGQDSSAINLDIGSNVITLLVTAQSGDTRNYTVVVNRLGSGDATLSGMTISSGVFDQTFDSELMSYTHSVVNAISSVTITPTANEANALIKVNDVVVASGAASASIPLVIGDNVINVLVTAQDTTTRTYTIVVSRAGSSNNNLTSLDINTGLLTPIFDSATTSYTHAVSYATTSVDITPVVAESNASITVNGNAIASASTQNVSLIVGSNAINTVVRAQDGSLKTYLITVTRSGNNNANLSDLVLSSGALSPGFSTGTLAYTQSISNAVQSVDVTATLQDTNATMTVESNAPLSGELVNVPMHVGDNIVDVVVTAQDGVTVKTYQVTISRGQSANADLGGLVLSAGAMDQAFSSGLQTYTETVSNSVTNLTVTPTLADGSASVTVDGMAVSSGQAAAVTLAVGDTVVPVVVTAEDSTTTKTYNITISRLSNDTSLSGLSTSTGGMSPSFVSGTHSYAESVLNTTTSITVTPTVTDSTSTVKVNGTTVISGAPSGAISLNVGSNLILVEVTAQDGSTLVYTIVVTRAGSNNAKLSDISLSTGTLSPAFVTTTFNYTATVSSAVSSLTLTPTTAEGTSSITVNGVDVTSGSASGSIDLDIGINSIYIVVTAQDASTQLYKVVVTRNGSTNADLAGLTAAAIGDFNEAFSAATINYTQTVTTTTSSVEITPSVADSAATVTVDGVSVTSGSASAAISLNIGDNVIPVLVTAESGANKSYTIVVTRQGSSDADLASLGVSVGSYTPAFDAATTAYAEMVSNATNSISITPTVSDSNAFVKVNGTSVSSGSSSAVSLNSGDNAVEIVVTAQEGNTKTYTITVNRKSVNANLSNLVLSTGGMDQAFSSTNIAYTQTVGNAQTSFTVTPYVEDSNASVEINGSPVSSGSASAAISLNVGDNTITVLVTAEDGNTKTYVITITRAANDATLSNLIASTGDFDQTFNSATVAYTQLVANGISSVTLTPTATHAQAAIMVNGVPVSSGQASAAISLSIGDNVNTITVTAQDGTIKTYTAIIHRQGSGDATLSDLVASTGIFDQTFNGSTSTYTQTVANNITSVTLTPTANQADAIIKVNDVAVNSGEVSGTIGLSIGDNIITTTVTAQDGTQKNYTSIIHRQGNSDATLSGLVASTGAFDQVFSSATFVYAQTVVNGVTSVSLTPTVNSGTSNVKVNGVLVASGQASTAIPLVIDDNVITTVVTAQDGTQKTYTVIVRRLGSNDATLSNLIASTGGFDQTFDSGVTYYTQTVVNATSSVTITPTATQADASIKVNDVSVLSGQVSGAITLTLGDNVITNGVTAQDGTQKTYTIVIHRLGSSDASLSGLTVSTGGFDQTFDSGVTYYTQTVVNATSSVTITPTASQANATIKVNDVSVLSGQASGTITLNLGDNVITNTVTAQDTTTKSYIIVITRAGSNDADLSNLSTTGAGTLTPGFASGTVNYTQSEPFSTNSVDITPTVNDANASVTVSGNAVTSGAPWTVPLAVGSNVINTVVTAQDGTLKTYTVTITRAGNNNADLTGIVLSTGAYVPASFASGTLSYTQSVANAVDNVDVTATLADANATMTVESNAPLSGETVNVPLAVGANIIDIIVTAEDSSTVKTYQVTITREESNNADLSGILISIGPLDQAFSSGTLSYTKTVSNSATSVSLIPTIAQSAATMTVDGVAKNSGEASAISLSVGDNIIPIVVTAEDGVTQKTYTITVSRESNDASLSNLVVSPTGLSPAFVSGTTSYTQSVTSGTTSLDVTPTTSDASSTIKVNGISVVSGGTEAVALNVGVNLVLVSITAQDGTEKVYSIAVTRAGSSNATLSSLSTSTTLIESFASGTKNYTDSVDFSVPTVTVSATATDTNSVVTINGVSVGDSGNQDVDLSIGTNKIFVTVSAQDATTDLYTITVTQTGSSDNTLSDLTTSIDSPDFTTTYGGAFASGTTSYSATVDNATTSMTVTPTANESNATITVAGVTVASAATSGSVSLVSGENVVPVIVTAQDGSNKSYMLVVTRQNSTDADLTDLTSSAGAITPVFDGTTTYTQSVSNATTSIDITPQLSDTNAFVTVNGGAGAHNTASTVNLNVGDNAIDVVVTSQQGNTKTYTITVHRKSANADLSNLILSTGGMNEAFISATTTYTQDVGNAQASLTVTPYVADANATVTVNGTGVTSGSASGAIALSVGDNVITTVVTAEDGNTKTYTTTVTRTSNDATLSNLIASVGAFDQGFASGTLAYSKVVSNATTDTTITPTATHAAATITVNAVSVASASASGSIALSIGDNVITTTVTAQDGTSKTYTVVIHRLGSNDATLSALTTNAEDGVFDQGVFVPATTTYTKTVLFTTISATVTPTVNEANATIIVNGATVTSGSASVPLSLNLGDNFFSIAVTAQDGTVKSYTVVLTRAGSGDATLSQLDTSFHGGAIPGFDPATNTYSESVLPGTASITVTPTANEGNATIKVNDVSVLSTQASNPIALNVGTNIINVVVTAQDESVNTYVLIIFRPGSSDGTLATLTTSVDNPGFIDTFGENFTSADTLYIATVTNAVSSMTFTPTVSDPNANVTVDDVLVSSGTQSQAVALSDTQLNIIPVTVLAADNSTNTYTFAITRLPSGVADLSNLTLSTGSLSPAFDTGVLSYTAVVSNATASIDITASVVDALSTIKIAGVSATVDVARTVNLPTVGDNAIDILVTAADSSTQTYTVTVRRKSTDATLSALSVSGGDLVPDFDPGTYTYSADVGYLVQSSQVTAAANHTGYATMTMNTVALSDNTPSTNLVDLSTYAGTATIEVTAEDGNTQTYTVNLTRDVAGTFAQQAYTKASDAAAAAASTVESYGSAVAISGDYMVVGSANAYSERGAAYVYKRNPLTDTWSEHATLIGNNSEAGDKFGASVAIDGDTIVVGAPLEDGKNGGIDGVDSNGPPSSYEAGAAYVFQLNGSGTTWVHQAKLKEPDSGANNTKFNHFGTAVAVSGDVVVVSSPSENSLSTVITDMNSTAAPMDTSAADSGAVFAFLRTGASWAYEAHIKVSSNVTADEWGQDIAMDGSTMVISSTLYNSNGAVAVFLRDTGTATWTQQGAVILSPSPSANEGFGMKVDISADTLIVAAPLEDSTATDSGAVYVYTRSVGSWSNEATVKATVVEASDQFGSDVGIAGDTLVVGSALEDSNATGVVSMSPNPAVDNDNSASAAGVAQIFTRSGVTWTHDIFLKAYNTGAGDQFGTAVDISGDTIVVGAPLESTDYTATYNPNPGADNDNRAESGAVYIFK